MKVTVKTQELADTVLQVKAGIPSKGSLPILHCVLVDARDGRLVVTGGDIETFIQASCRAKILHPGSICIPAVQLIDSLKALAGESATVNLLVVRVKTTVPLNYEEREKLKAEGTPPEKIPSTKPGWRHEFRIEAGKTWATINTQDAKEYPHVPEVKATNVIQFRNLVSAIGEIDYAMAHEENRPVLHGICMKQVNGHIALTAADGFRLATNLVKTRGRADSEVIIPFTTVTAIKKLMPEYTRVEIMERQKNNAMPNDEIQKLHYLAFRDKKGTVSILAQALDGAFPKYEQLIPKNTKKLTVAKSAIEQALRVMATLKDKSPVRLQKKAGELVISRSNTERDISTKVPAKGSIKIALDIEYLKELVRRLGDEIVFRWKDGTTPLMVKHGSTTHVVMPRNVQW